MEPREIWIQGKYCDHINHTVDIRIQYEFLYQNEGVEERCRVFTTCNNQQGCDYIKDCHWCEGKGLSKRPNDITKRILREHGAFH